MASGHSHVSHFDGRVNKDDLDVYTINAIKNCASTIKLTFKDVNFQVETTTKTKVCGKAAKENLHILKGISGFAMPGKTSLLNLLSDRIRIRNGVSISGTINFNDKVPVNQKSFGQVGSYVMQDDILFEFFTVREALTFAARLKLTIPIEE